MGYRSEVALAISKELMPHFLTVFAKCPEARTMVFKDHDKMDENYDGEGTFFVHWDNVKWYDSYPEVKAVENFLDDCELDDFDDIECSYNHYRFVRLGEEPNDVEIRGDLCGCDIGYVRQLTF
jgi:hypothetical protein